MSYIVGSKQRFTCRFCRFEGAYRTIKRHEEVDHTDELAANKSGAPCPPAYAYCEVCNLRVASLKRHNKSRYHKDRRQKQFGVKAPPNARRGDDVDASDQPPAKTQRMPPPSRVDPHDGASSLSDDDRRASDIGAEDVPPLHDHGAAPHAIDLPRRCQAPLGREFLYDRDDSAHFTEHPRCGLAVLFPLKVNARDNTDLDVRLKDRNEYWRRWRIVKVSPTDLCTVYPLDYYESYAAALERQAQGMDKGWELCVQEQPLALLDQKGYNLGKDAILMNFDDTHDLCCECGREFPTHGCQGFWPPVFNRRSKCKRGSACEECYGTYQLVEKPRPKATEQSNSSTAASASAAARVTTRGGGGGGGFPKVKARGRARGGIGRGAATGDGRGGRGRGGGNAIIDDDDDDDDDDDSGPRRVYYLCRRCRAPPIDPDRGVFHATHRDLACWQIFGPPDLKRPRRFADVEPPEDAPIAPSDFLTHPADTRAIEDEATRIRHDAARREFGPNKTKVATELLRAFRLSNMSTDQQEAVLRAIRACNSKDKGTLLNLNNNVPADKITLEKWGAPFLPSSGAVRHTSVMLDAENLMQGQGRTQLTFGSIRDLVQVNVLMVRRDIHTHTPHPPPSLSHT